jgi:hypothetical protein
MPRKRTTNNDSPRRVVAEIVLSIDIRINGPGGD